MAQTKIIPTAEEFFNKRSNELGFENWINVIVQQEWDVIEKLPIEFAKLHREAILKAVNEKGKVSFKRKTTKVAGGYVEVTVIPVIEKKSILNAYPLINIK